MTYRTRAQMEEETAAAKACSILLIAEHFGYALKQHGNYHFADDDKRLVFFNQTNSFYNYYEQRGGSGIDFVMEEKGCSVGDAIRYINTEISPISINYENNHPNRQVGYERIKSAEELKIPQKNTNHRRVFAYLTKTRGISPEIVSDFLHKHLLYEEAGKHNCVFVGYDKSMKPRHCFIRGTVSNRQYRGDTYGSDKKYGFLVHAEHTPPKGSKLIVFEAPIDIMSYKSLYPEDKDSDMLALGMLSPEPVYTYLADHQDCKDISFILDVDQYGKKAALEFVEKLQSEGYHAQIHQVCSLIEKVHAKDMNELLQVINSRKAVIQGGQKL